ncbi:MAG: DUF362 domain-containing protein [Bryobacteraceae bacterium]
MIKRRTFLELSAAAPVLLAAEKITVPAYDVETAFKPSAHPGMPGPYPGRVISVHSDKSIAAGSNKVDQAVVREMIDRGMRTLTGAPRPIDAWRKMFVASDVVGIKVNCSGAPRVCSSPEIVGEIVRNLVAVGVKPASIYIYERFQNQLESVGYQHYVPAGVNIVAIEVPRNSLQNYDGKTYVEVNFFGDEDTRSYMVGLVCHKFTKIINVPNMKDHGAAGVTGCLKNIAYGNFDNVARSHKGSKTNTLTFIGTLASVEPLRSKTVLQIMDGLKGVWHGGPFVRDAKFVFYPKQMIFGTDPVAIDHIELDEIDAERKRHGAISVWDRSPNNLDPEKFGRDADANSFIREPGHIEYAAGKGLGVYDLKKIQYQRIEV